MIDPNVRWEKRRYYGGVPFDFQVHLDTWLSRVSERAMDFAEFKPDYLSGLITQAYREDMDIKQPVLDALTPFQLVSKGWATKALKLAIRKWRENSAPSIEEYRNRYAFRYHGSWFGQSAELDRDENSRLMACQTLIDLDPQAVRVASELLHRMPTGAFNEFGEPDNDMGIYTRPVECICGNALTEPFKYPQRNVVVWTGIEHFDKEDVWKFVDAAPNQTLFLLQGTDRPEPDHKHKVASLLDVVDSKAELEDRHIWYFLGSVTCPYGTRYMSIFEKAS